MCIRMAIKDDMRSLSPELRQIRVMAGNSQGAGRAGEGRKCTLWSTRRPSSQVAEVSGAIFNIIGLLAFYANSMR